MEKVDAAEVSVWLQGNDVLKTVSIRKNEQPHAVMIPYEIFQAMRVEALDERDMEIIANSRVPEDDSE